MIIPKSILIGGKRKTAIAKAKITEGTGKIVVNNKPYENLDFFKKLMIQEPVEITKKTLGHFNFDIKVNVKGSGQESQRHAARLSVARALVKFTDSQDLKKAFSKYDKNLLVADTRRKEANKPGDSKARRKRQKSFR
jgi:small subunit ribosomal protein S9